MRRPSLRAAAALLLMTGLAAAPLPVLAHAIIVAASPAVDGVVHGGDLAVNLRFNSRIDHDRSRLTLIAPDGRSLPILPGKADPTDVMTATATGLAPGDYRLRWQVLAIDGHITRGDIPFRVTQP